MDKEQYLKTWGFLPRYYLKEFPPLKPKIKSFIDSYLDNFPTPGGDSILFIGGASIINHLIGRMVYLLTVEKNKVRHKITVLDIPKTLTYYVLNMDIGSTFKMFTDLEGSDLIIFQEIGLNKWSQAQQARLYVLLNERYSKNKPFFCTSSLGLQELSDNIGLANYDRLADLCTTLDVGYGN